jgi:ferredoxin-type protein NapF
MLGVLLLSFVWPHSWCGRLCPLGAFQDILATVARFLRRIIHPTNASLPAEPWNLRLARRTVFGAAIAVACASVVRAARRSVTRPLRPPGAADEPQFLGLCVRCGNCIRACPTRIIEPDLGQHGLASLLTPMVRFQEGYCLVDCTACTRACPSGALAHLSPEDKTRTRIGTARVDMNVCLLGESRECVECRNWCPHEAIRYIFSESDYTLVPQIDARKCTGCGACEVACPTKPDKAIVVVLDLRDERETI